MNIKRKVVITGLGVVSPIGLNVAELINSLKGGHSGISLCGAPPLLKKFAAGSIPHDFSSSFTKLELPYLDRCQQMAIIAANQAIKDAGYSNFAEYKHRAGLYYGTVNGGSESEQSWYQQMYVEEKQAARPFSIMAIMHNGGAAQISIRNKIMGPVSTHGSACASSGSAIGEAMRAIRDGYLDVAIAGGAEAPLTAYLFGLFEGTRALATPDLDDARRTCKPFSIDRDGLVLGEGAAFIIIESEEHAKQRGAKCYAELKGYGVASDAYHIGSPNSEGQIAAIKAALDDAELNPYEVGYFNAHGTATKGGDEVEANAIRSVFGNSIESAFVSSTKSAHGHLLGAASALELIISIVSINNSILPATLNVSNLDDRCSLNHVLNEPKLNHSVETAMSFSCGFGGTNVALAVSKYRKS